MIDVFESEVGLVVDSFADNTKRRYARRLPPRGLPCSLPFLSLLPPRANGRRDPAPIAGNDEGTCGPLALERVMGKASQPCTWSSFAIEIAPRQH
ncbi:hypothetical protein SORBI_3010G110050 [Sorghum bicolor]|uniref:Uncharacterized protein n=1 Tax=Sorghum bicolor TaxID=4558 RepID=A0A1W0VSH8_SORBI|nr:hypothetical protein SORBI_3010G110050 [Sorghum bicolor]